MNGYLQDFDYSPDIQVLEKMLDKYNGYDKQLFLSFLLLHSTHFKDIEVTKFSLDNGANINSMNLDNDTALILASHSGNEKCTELLLERGADINVQGYGGFTALHCAAEMENFDIMKLLLENGADTNIRDDNGYIWKDIICDYDVLGEMELFENEINMVNIKPCKRS